MNTLLLCSFVFCLAVRASFDSTRWRAFLLGCAVASLALMQVG